MTILRNPRNGQVRAILRDLADADVSQADAAAIAAGAALDVLFSRGIPDAAAWRRGGAELRSRGAEADPSAPARVTRPSAREVQ